MYRAHCRLRSLTSNIGNNRGSLVILSEAKDLDGQPDAERSEA